MMPHLTKWLATRKARRRAVWWPLMLAGSLLVTKVFWGMSWSAVLYAVLALTVLALLGTGVFHLLLWIDAGADE